MKRLKEVLLLFFLLVLLSCNNEPSQQKEVSSKSKGSNFTGVELVQLDGQPIDWDQYKGKAVFINFWATWCKPCIEEMPSIRVIKDKLKDANIVFLLASDETAQQIEKFKQKNNYDFQFVRVTNLEQLGIMAIPTTYIFDPAGKLVFSEMGYRKWDNNENLSMVSNIAGVK